MRIRQNWLNHKLEVEGKLEITAPVWGKHKGHEPFANTVPEHTSTEQTHQLDRLSKIAREHSWPTFKPNPAS